MMWFLFFTLALQHGATDRPPSPPDVATLLPPGSFEVQVLDLAASPRQLELAAKLPAAVARDPDWWLAHVQQSAPARPLKYDAKIALTEEDFKKFHVLSENPRLQTIARTKLTAIVVGEDAVRLSARDLHGIDGLVIDSAENTVTGRFGVAVDVSEIHQADFNSPTEPHSSSGSPSVARIAMSLSVTIPTMLP